MPSRLNTRLRTNRQSRIGAIISSATMAFARASAGYQDGVSYPANTPRFPSNSGTKGLINEEGTTNLLTANQASVETDTTGFTSEGANSVLLRDTSVAWAGAASLKVVTGGAGTAEGVSLLYTTATQGSYTGQTHLTGSGTVNVWIRITYTDLTTTDGPLTPVTLTSTFQEVKTAPAASNGAKTVSNVRLHIRTIGTQAITFWVDGNQLESKAYSTSWMPGGATRAAETTTVPTAGLLVPSAGSVIIETYVNGNNLSATPAAQRNLFSFSSGGNRIEIRRNTAGVFQAAAEGGGAFTPASWNPGAIAEGVHRYCLGYDGTGVVLAADGLDRATATPATPLASVDFPMGIGCLPSGFFQWNSPVQRVWFYARKLSSAERAAATAGTLPSDFTAYLDFTAGALKVNLGHPWHLAESLNLLYDPPDSRY